MTGGQQEVGMERLIAAGAGHALALAATYIAALVVIGIVLTFRVIGQRRAAQIGLGDGGDRVLTRRIRAHGNYAETAPIIMVLLVMLALLGAREWQMHVVGLSGVVGRVLHAVGLSGSGGVSLGRQVGMVLTLTAKLVGIALMLFLALA
jgi:uncharacterized membrane protein YecN with MAPEG domain